MTPRLRMGLLGLALLLPLAARTATAAAVPARVPDVIARHFTADDIARGRAYSRGRYLLFASGVVLRLALLALLLFTPLSAWLRDLAGRLASGRPNATVVVYGLLLFIGYEVLILPVGFYGGFLREKAFGLSTETAAAWLLNRAKEAGVSAAIGLPCLVAAYALIRHWPTWWFLPAGALASTTMIVLIALAPIILDPIFFTFTPLPDASLRARLLALLDRAGLPAREIWVMDASRRTVKTNAYFTGLGRTKRIVLYDTLVQKSSPEEVELVLAHEIGHWKHHHIRKGIVIAVPSIFLILGIAAAILRWAGRHGNFSLRGPGDVAGLPLLFLVLFIGSLVSLPIQNLISRSFERQADLESLRLTGDTRAFIQAEVNLARTNLADLDPPRWIVDLLYTHPPVGERIGMAKAFAEGRIR